MAKTWSALPGSRSNGRSGIEQVVRAGPVGRQLVVRVGDPALPQRQAATSDAASESVAHALQQADLLVQSPPPGGGQARPVRFGRGTATGQGGQRLRHFVEGEANPLGNPDKCDASKLAAVVAPLIASAAVGPDESACLVEPERGGGDPATLRHLSDGQLFHVTSP